MWLAAGIFKLDMMPSGWSLVDTITLNIGISNSNASVEEERNCMVSQVLKATNRAIKTSMLSEISLAVLFTFRILLPEARTTVKEFKSSCSEKCALFQSVKEDPIHQSTIRCRCVGCVYLESYLVTVA
ncbi:hypothetical protein Tco_1507700 [Tanacetum coccineum]